MARPEPKSIPIQKRWVEDSRDPVVIKKKKKQVTKAPK